jgi:hypothetical protein
MLTSNSKSDTRLQANPLDRPLNTGRSNSSNCEVTGAIARGYLVIGFKATKTTVNFVRNWLYDLTNVRFNEI